MEGASYVLLLWDHSGAAGRGHRDTFCLLTVVISNNNNRAQQKTPHDSGRTANVANNIPGLIIIHFELVLQLSLYLGQIINFVYRMSSTLRDSSSFFSGPTDSPKPNGCTRAELHE